MKKLVSVLLTLIVTAMLLPSAAVCAADFTVSKSGAAVIPNGSKSISEKAFKDNTKLTSAVIPDGCAVGKEAFANCVNLKSVTFEGNSSYIDDEAFLNCTSLEKLNFKNPAANIKYIGKSAFANCFALETVSLPSKTGEIREFAFGNCTSLSTVTVPQNVSVTGKWAVGYMHDEKSGDYYAADGETEAYVSYYRMFNGDLLEWYSPNKGCAVTMNVVKDSSAEKYARDNGIKYAHFKSVEPPDVTASAEKDSVVLKWNKINGADAYRVSILKNGRFTEYKTTTAKKCTVSGLESGQSYTFKVSVMSTAKNGKYTELISSGEITVTTKAPEATAPKKQKSDIPEAPSVTAEASTSSITLRWKKVDGADAYQVMVFNSEKNRYEKYKNTVGRTCTVSELASGTQYKFKVISLYSEKNKYIEGKSTDEIVISTAEIVKTK
ncbi:MAG: fibronectin type III domain-containing protein [Oscillospiraceae bacterium]|nr:fibronectin type III domain-containing protein [Oscillospiraceae bacterium]